MDKDQSEQENQNPNDYYRFEVHIMFDDAYKDDIFVNEFVTEFKSVIDEATSHRNSERIHLEGPFPFSACYGGQDVYKMPGGNLMFIHWKNKTKIRRKKRWSQVMYMYYLLGYRLQREYMQEKNKTVDIDDLFKKRPKIHLSLHWMVMWISNPSRSEF